MGDPWSRERKTGERVDILVVHNLGSGQGDAGLFDYIRELSAAGAEVTLRSMGGGEGGGAAPLERALRGAEGFDRVVAAGGDGTVSSVAYRLRGTGIPVFPYPAGTANLAALNLRIPADPARCAEITLGGEILTVDLGEICYAASSGEVPDPPQGGCGPDLPLSTGFVNGAGAGLDA